MIYQKQNNMTTIIAPQATSVLNNGVFFDNGKFFDKYKNELSNEWVEYVYWSNQNSRYGSDIADLRTAKFCKDYNIAK